MKDEAERLAQELEAPIEGYIAPTLLEEKAAALLRSQAAEIERLKLQLLSASEGTKDREHAEKYLKQAEKLLTANEQTLHAEIGRLTAERDKYHMECLERRLPENNGAMEREGIKRLTAENEANMQTCKGIIKGLTADRKRKDALLRECLTALEYHTDHTLDTMDKVKTELGEQT